MFKKLPTFSRKDFKNGENAYTAVQIKKWHFMS